MPNAPAGMRVCPTRADGQPALFAHVITQATCQESQRRHFHKCPTCNFCNARQGVRPPPAEVPRPQLPTRQPARRLAGSASAPAALARPARPA